MIFSVCTTGYKELTIEETLQRVSEMGLDGVEIWIGHIEDYVERNGSIEGLKTLLSTYHLVVPAISEYTYFSKSEEERIESSHKLKTAVKRAHELECPMVRTFAGHIPSKEASKTQWGNMIAGLRDGLDFANQYQVNIAIEIHNNTFADNIDAITSILTEIDHPRLRLIFDGFNLYIDGINQMDAFQCLYKWVDHVHMKNYIWDHKDWSNSIPTSLFKGDVDYSVLFTELIERDYQGYLSFEYFGEQGESCILASLKELKERGIRKN